MSLKQERLKKSITHFSEWLSKNGRISYDQYDFWSTKYGKFSKKIYYSNKLIGSILVSPIFILEIVLPNSRKLFVTRKSFPIANAHLILAKINMYQVENNELYLDEAIKIGEDLLKSSIKGYSGYCWGYPFDWMTNRGLWQQNIPLITSTPYCFEAFLALYDVTKNKKYFDIAYSIFMFSLNDINQIEISENEIASSYSPIDKSKVINASAYRAFILAESYKRFKNEDAKILANKLLNFIMSNQNEDGSWLYAIENPQDAFIDNFHTCFVLKNLYKSNLIFQRNDIEKCIIKGYGYYRNNLITNDIVPIPFASLGRFNIVKEEMYDYAEGILLGVLLNDLIPNSIKVSEAFAERLISKYQTSKGNYITKKMIFGLKNAIPYMRWPQSQLFYALSTLYKYNEKNN